MHFGWIAIAFLSVVGADPFIANDVVSHYAEVKELLTAFYRRNAARYGNDYNPTELARITANSEDKPINDKTEASVNRKLWTEVFENDIILTLPQAEALLKETDSLREKRQASPDVRNFWPNLTISYEFYGGEDTWRNLIRNAIKHVESRICIKFQENGPDKDGLRYYRGQGCWSNVGRIGGKQLVSIGYGCDGLGIVSHETLHALGLWHEQSRTDRDSFISIVLDKITRGTEGNFAKRTLTNSDNLGQPYDLGSVMHYGSKAFAYDWTSDTITTKDPRFQQTIGQREGISFKDAKMINTRYCQDVCPVKLSCKNEGYTDPNNCSQCRCPTGYGGKLCDSVEPTSCGGTLTSNSQYQNLTSGGVYPNAHCVWRIKNENGGKIELKFDSVSFQCTDPCPSYVEVKFLKSKTSTGARLCCKTPATFYSEGDDVVLIFRGSADSAIGWLGFNLNYRSYGNPAPSVTTTTSTAAPTTTSPYWAKTASGWVHYEKSEYNITSFTWNNTIQEDDVKANRSQLPATPTVTYTRPTSIASWGIWGEWSSCSQPCGGCGTRTRVRGCYGGNRRCNGDALVTQSCNAQTCAKPKKGMICDGRIVLPCSLLGQLKFGSNNFLNPRFRAVGFARSGLPLPRVSSRQPFSEREVHPPERNSFYDAPFRRVKRQSAVALCEKKFIYQCPVNTLTINIGYKNPNKEKLSDAIFESPECCLGYSPQNGICYNNGSQ